MRQTSLTDTTTVSPPQQTMNLPPMIPAAPFTLERHTHFQTSQVGVDRLLDTLRTAMAAAGDTPKLDYQKHIFHGLFDGTTGNYMVCIFRAHRGHVVEFRRLCGSSFVWHCFYDHIISLCGDLVPGHARAACQRMKTREARRNSTL